MMDKPELDLIDNAPGILIALAVFASAFFFIEKIRPAEPETPYFKKDFKRELGLALLNGILLIPVFTFLVGISVVVLLQKFVPYQIFDEHLVKIPILAQMFLGAFIIDFGTYWRHRFTHAYMWPYHAIHHSVLEITWISALRLHPVEYLVAIIIDTTVLYIFGFSGDGIIFATLFVILYNYYLHANLNIAYSKPFCYILASPHFHRWHHANEKAAYDKNFCSIYSLLDVIFGTYHHPDELPKAYGLSPAQAKEFPDSLSGLLVYPLKKNLNYFKKKKN